jgi:ferritin
MLSWIIQITIISIILIFLVHYLFNFFKETLTVPKIKDLVNVPNKKYENMYNIIKNSKSGSNDSSNNEYTLIDLLPKTNEPNMKSELKNFLKKQMNKNNNGTDIATLDSMADSSSYSIY